MVRLFGFDIRWYGLAYVLGFYLGFLVLRWLAKRDRFVLPPDRVADFLTYAFLFGVFVGGRLGYMLLYDFDHFVRNPLVFFRIREGGMASHGGILGLFLFTLWYARRHQVSWPGLGDGLVVVAPIGILLGRLANFVNGELYGRVTSSRWGVVFPAALWEPSHAPEADPALWQSIGEAAPAIAEVPRSEVVARTIDWSRTNEALQAVLARELPPRHPSQLYEAFLEGALLFAILMGVRLRWPRLPHGVLTGLFFLLYGAFRIAVESLREPDASRILGLTRGQFYSTFMIVVGGVFLAFAFLRRRREPDAG